MSKIRRSSDSGTPERDAIWQVVPVVQRVVGRTGKARFLMTFRCGYCRDMHLSSVGSLTVERLVRKAACGRGRIALRVPLEARVS